MKIIYIILSFIVLSFIISSSGIAQHTMPDPPKFISASVLPDISPTTVKLSWRACDSIKVNRYLIYNVVNSITEIIDTVYGRYNTEYSYIINTIDYHNPQKFRLASIDSDNNKSIITDPHTIMLLSYSYDLCSQKIKLSWNAYNGWQHGVEKYNIYYKKDSEPYRCLVSLSDNDLSYEDSEILTNHQYSYYIEAVSKGDNYISTSNSISLYTNYFVAPSVLTALYASVEEEAISLKFIVSNSTSIKEFHLERSDNSPNNFNLLRIIQNNGQNEIETTDNEVVIDKNKYYYRLVVIDSCDNEIAKSNIVLNILLTANIEEDFNHTIKWIDYIPLSSAGFSYNLYKYFNNSEAEIAVLRSGQSDYQYDITSYVIYCHQKKLFLSNKFCYYVIANEFVNTSGYTGTINIKSNKSCVYHEPIVWFPNVLNTGSNTPDNKVFKPIISFAGEVYEFTIYDKWGFEIFKTNDPNVSWDGCYKGKPCVSQYYMYVLKYQDYKNKDYIKSGMFFLFM